MDNLKISISLGNPLKMKQEGYVPVDIPTKKYIKAYVLHKLGPKPYMDNQSSSIGDKLHDLLQHNLKDSASRFESKLYKETLRIYVPVNLYRKKAHHLNKENIKNFNLFIEAELKDHFHFMMDYIVTVLPNFTSNLPEIRRKLGIDVEAWKDDSMKKDYYRYRLRNNKSVEYTKLFVREN